MITGCTDSRLAHLSVKEIDQQQVHPPGLFSTRRRLPGPGKFVHMKAKRDERIHEQVDEGGDEQRFEVFECRPPYLSRTPVDSMDETGRGHEGGVLYHGDCRVGFQPPRSDTF